MAQDLVPSGGGGGQLIITVNATQAMSNLALLQQKIIYLTTTTQNNMSAMTKSFNSFQMTIGKVLTAIGGFLALREVTRLTESFLSRMIEVNRVTVGFMASMSVIKGSLSGAAVEYKFLVDMSKRLGVALEQAIPQYHRLAAAMKNVDKDGTITRNIFTGISEAAIVLQSRGHDVTLIFEAIQQMASKGKLSLEELQRQLGNTLPGAISIAARAMMTSSSFIAKGITTVGAAEQELRRQIAKGEINVYEFLIRFSNQLKKEYGAGVEFASNQFIGNFNRMQTAVFEFFRLVGDAGAMKALSNLANAVTKLFNPEGASQVGSTLGKGIQSIADWVGSLDSTNVSEFFATVNLALQTTGILVSEFLKVFDGIGGLEMETPLLNFAEFTAKAFAVVVDMIGTLSATIEGLIRSVYQMYLVLEEAPKRLMDAKAWIGNKTGFVSDADYAAYNSRRANDQAAISSNYARMNQNADRAYNGVMGDMTTLPAYSRVGTAFDNARTNLYLQNQGLGNAGYNANAVPNYLAPQSAPKPFSGMGSLNYKGGALPSYLFRPGHTDNSATDPFINPLNDNQIKALMDQLKANGSSAPNSPKSGSTSDPSGTAYMRETTRLVKEQALAMNELDNVYANKNLTEGKAVAQMRALLITDERYIGMTKTQKDALMAKAEALDAVNRKLEEAIKVQSYHNDTMQMSLDIQQQIDSLNSTGYVSKYGETQKISNSFQKGGENEMMSQEAQRKMIADAEKRDNQQRLLDMAMLKAQITQQNAELEFQASLYGKSALEVQKLQEFHKVDLEIQKMSVGATVEMQQEYLRLGEILKTQISETLDKIHAQQQDMLGGMRKGVTDYMDSISDRAGQMADVTQNALSGMEDAFVRFAETGKLSFSDLARSIVKDLLRIIIKMLILWILQKVTGIGGGGGGGTALDSGASGAGAALAVGFGGAGGFVAPNYKGNVLGYGRIQQYAKGGVFNQTAMFATGGTVGTAFEKNSEAIMPLARDRSGQLGVKVANPGANGDGESTLNLTVEVYQGEGNNVSTKKEKNEKGDILKIFIGEVATDIQRGGLVAKSITATYGVRRSAKTYD